MLTNFHLDLPRQENEPCTGTKENPKQELNHFQLLTRINFSPFSHNCAHEPSNKTATMYLLFLFLFGHFSRFLTFFSDFLFWFLSDFSRFLTFFSDLWFRPNSEVFWFLWEVPILNLFSEIRSWTRTFFSYFFFSFSSLDPFDLNNLSFSNFGLRYSNPPH